MTTTTIMSIKLFCQRYLSAKLRP